jgi:serine/threonine-protein kinase
MPTLDSTRAPADDLVGQRLGNRYRLVEILGAGGYGTVFSAVDERDGAPVAVKVLHPHLAHEPSVFARFVRETEIALRFDHAGLLRGLARHVVSPDEPCYLVTERLVGCTLEAVVGMGESLDGYSAARIALSILGGLEAIHAAGYVHRDVKPENVFLVGSELATAKAKLVDYGTTRPTEVPTPRLTVPGEVVGTLSYAPPEQIFEGRVEPRGDLYGLGLALYVALTGVRPFRRGSPGETLLALSHGVVEPLESLRPDLDRAFVGILHRAIAPSPDARYPTAWAMRKDVAAWLRGREARAAKRIVLPTTRPVVTEGAEASDTVVDRAPPFEEMPSTGTFPRVGAKSEDPEDSYGADRRAILPGK